jgi:4-diphosphocytidyl-2-C-methyl-D-erythritol kinase
MVNPGLHISTVEAYSGVQAKRSDKDLRTVLKEPVVSWRGQIKNDFEATLFVKYPLLGAIKNDLYNLGAAYASMSGSGSTLYGIFDEEKNLKENFSNYKVWQGFLGLNLMFPIVREGRELSLYSPIAFNARFLIRYENK